MRYLRQHILEIIGRYDGSQPLAHFLKEHFRRHPKLGSRDRKMLTTLAYSWYRCSKGIDDQGWPDMLLSEWANDPAAFRNFSLLQWLDNHKPELSFHIDSLFPFDALLSEGIEKEAWLHSMLVQPDLFIRIRKDKGKIESLLKEQQIPFTFISDTCIALPNSTKIEAVLPPDSYVVQDASSQRTGTFFHPAKGESWYDCCSGAGGKSLLLKDLQPDVKLTVSDKRESIIANLKKRFQQYHHKLPISHIADATEKGALSAALGNATFDAIICDAPCSGSGTWSRTPEQLYFFNPDSVEKYSALQKNIAVNVSQYLKPGGRLIYITCSIFRQENEDVVNEVIHQTGLKLTEARLINGINIKADSMFITILSH